ncbi:MAG TPA: hypothetical protein PKJ17_11200, partial [Syntrophorhabdaceae bacterium]|nr:hypothetical protein [Syntrophorhabdaceae bacterium]
ACIFVAVCMLLIQPGCTGEGEKSPGPQDAKTEPQTRQAKAGGFTVPEEGTPAERVRKLWESTGPIMKVDAQANLIDREYQNKRTPLFSVWVTLQGKLSLAPQKDERAQRVIPEVLKLIDDLYGFPGFTEERREKDRETAKKFFDKRYGRLEEEIKALK